MPNERKPRILCGVGFLSLCVYKLLHIIRQWAFEMH